MLLREARLVLVAWSALFRDFRRCDGAAGACISELRSQKRLGETGQNDRAGELGQIDLELDAVLEIERIFDLERIAVGYFVYDIVPGVWNDIVLLHVHGCVLEDNLLWEELVWQLHEVRVEPVNFRVQQQIIQAAKELDNFANDVQVDLFRVPVHKGLQLDALKLDGNVLLHQLLGGDALFDLALDLEVAFQALPLRRS